MSVARFAFVLAVAFVFGSISSLAAGGPLAFTSPKVVDHTDSSGEPGIKVDALGHVYVNSLSALHDTIHVSVDGGATFAPIHHANLGVGGGDDALAIDDYGGVYLAGQFSYQRRGCQSVASSLDKGVTWTIALAPCRAGVDGQLGSPTDRPWLAVYRPDATALPILLMVHHAPCCNGEHWAVRSLDGGVTFELAGKVSSRGNFPGNLLFDAPRERAYSFHSCWDGVCMARSDDFGASWTERVVANRWGPGLHRVVGAVDTAGNLYVVWASNWYAPIDVFMAKSTDGGASWSSPTKVSTTSGTHIMPWIVAGDPGKVDVVWYETSKLGDPDSPADMQAGNANSWALWDVKFAQSLDALSPAPTWQEVKVSPLPVHRGVLCSAGLWCNQNGRNRDLLDFFEVTLDPQGYAHMVYAQDENSPQLAPGVPLQVGSALNVYVRQTTGASLYD